MWNCIAVCGWVTESCSTTLWLKIVQLINLWFWLKLEVQMYNMVLSQVLGCSTSKAYTSTMLEAIYIDLKRHNSLHDIQNYSMLQIYWGRDVPQDLPETTWSYHMCLSYTSHVFSVAPAEFSLSHCTFCFQVTCWLMNFLFHPHIASVKYRMFFVSKGVAQSYALRHENSSLQEIKNSIPHYSPWILS